MLHKTKFIGIDPGYERLGMAIIERGEKGEESLIFSSCIETPPQKKHSERLLGISNAVDRCIKEHKPEIMAIESLFFNTNQKTMSKVAEARGVVISRAAFYKIEVHEFTPLEIKQAITGYGRSNKKQVISMLPNIIKVKKEIKHDDEYDAIAVGLTCTAVLGSYMLK
ncbi:MAG: crossover junction endodeoxyribonuclease RuvC [Patescibacteria group bacterium]